MILTLDRAAKATRGEVRNPDRFPSQLRVVTDTRALQPGDTFLALRGERFDGHAYVGEALSKGASAVVVEHESAAQNTPALLVSDTKRAYMDLAGAARDLYRGRVLAITGSAGKTTTKHLLAQLLAAHFGDAAVIATQANENNEIGVSKLLLSAAEEHVVMVVEMGARHEGEIAQLVEIARPHVGVLTNIGEAHLEIFGSRERLARTKWGLFSQGAQAVLNASDADSLTRSAQLPTPPLWFGIGEPTQPGVWLSDAQTLLLTYAAAPQSYSTNVRLPGTHNRANLAAAVAAALLVGIPPARLAQSAQNLRLPAGRYEAIDAANGVRLIYDAYNANVSGTIAALDAFAQEPGKRRIAVLASMAELGAEAPAMHERVGAHAASSNVDALLVGGDYAASIAAGALAAGYPNDRIVRFAGNGEAANWVREHADPGDVVLLKGSRKYAMEEIVEVLRA